MVRNHTCTEVNVYTYLVFLTWPCNVTEQQDGTDKNKKQGDYQLPFSLTRLDMVRNRTCTEVNVYTYLVFLTWPCNVTEQQDGRQKVALRLLRLIYLELALDPRFSPLQLERSTTLHFISGSSDLNSHVCAHTMLKALSTQKWLLWLPSLKVLRVKETSCSSKEVTLVKIHWQWFGTLTKMFVEMAC